MNTTLPDALHTDGAVSSGLGEMADSSSPSPFEAWPEQAIDACAPEGGYSPYAVSADIRTDRI